MCRWCNLYTFINEKEKLQTNTRADLYTIWIKHSLKIFKNTRRVLQHVRSFSRTVYGLVKTKSLKRFGGRRWRSDRLSTGLGGDSAEVGATPGLLRGAVSWLGAGGFTSSGTVVGNSLDCGQTGTDTSVGAWSDDRGGGSFVFRR